LLQDAATLEEGECKGTTLSYTSNTPGAAH